MLRSTIGIAEPVRYDATALTCATGSLPAVEDTGTSVEASDLPARRS
jgi:hypothetical protein